MQLLKLFFYRWGMRYNFKAAVLKYKQDKNNPVIGKHIEACNIYATMILKISPNDVDANDKYAWTLEVMSNSSR